MITSTSMSCALILLLAHGAQALRVAPLRVVSATARASTLVMELSMSEQIAKLEASLADLESSGVGEAVLAPIKGQIQELKIQDLEAQINALKDEDAEEAAPPAAPAAAAAPPVESFDPFPDPAAIGVDGLRSIVIFYAYDGIPKAEVLLETFEDEAAEIAQCGCALVAVRRVAGGDPGDERKAGEYVERFPSLNFVTGLDKLAPQLGAASPTLNEGGMGIEWARSLYNEPLVALLDPDGGMRTLLSHRGLSAANVLGKVMRDLHVAVPRADARVGYAEAEANRQSLHNANVAWADVLKEVRAHACNWRLQPRV